MKHIVIPFLALLMLCACQKASIYDDEPKPETKPNLIVNVFEIEQTPFSDITRAEPAEACTRLNFLVYDMEDKRVKYVNQQVGEEDFGTASFQLDEGDYYLVVVAHSSDGNPTTTNPVKIQFTNKQGYSDTFLSSGIINIGSDLLEQKVHLDRITALCRFVITDDYPDDVARMRFYYTGGSGAFDSTTGFGNVNSKQTVFFDVADGQKQFDLYTFPHDIEGTIHLLVTALDAEDNVIKEHEFDVPITQNKITWLSGPYFTGSHSGSTTVSAVNINTEWAGEIHLTF
jgi:hypothetical protein